MWGVETGLWHRKACRGVRKVKPGKGPSTWWVQPLAKGILMVPLDPTQCISSVVGGDGEFWWSKQRLNVIGH